MTIRPTRLSLLLAAAATPFLFLACGGGSSSSSAPAPSSGQVNLSVSDASTEDWATIGVKILSITLTPQGGGTPVTVYTAPSTVPTSNLVQLDNLSDLLNVAQVQAGTYTGATLTVSANPGDVSLVVANDPEAGFAGTPGATIPQANIQIQGTKGTSPNLTVPVHVTFASPVTVVANQTTPVDLEFDLAHPAFIVDHVPATGTGTFWAVSFNGPMVRHHPIHDMREVILRHMYGTVSTVSADNTSITITKDHAVWPPTSPETEITTATNLTVLADATNKTLYYDVDAGTETPISDFSTLASTLDGKFVRIAARYQQDGTLVAVRLWASSTFQKVWVSPEGHVLHVNTTNQTAPLITVANEDGTAVDLQVGSGTQFFFRTPEKALADATPIGQGPSFLIANGVPTGNLVRGFKVHASVVDPLAAPPLTAQTVDIEIAKYDGVISAAGASTFTYTRAYRTATDDYVKPLSYIASATPDGQDATGTAIDGFKWWNFAFPTILDDGANAISDFMAATDGSVNFYTPAAPVNAWGVSGCVFNDPAAAGWSARWTVLEPVQLPLGSVGTVWSSTATGGTFGMVVPTGTNTVNVNLDAQSGQATLVYQVDRTNGIVTVSQMDLTDAATLQTVAQNLILNTKVKVFGIPTTTSNTLTAYVVFYYTGSAPSM